MLLRFSSLISGKSVSMLKCDVKLWRMTILCTKLHGDIFDAFLTLTRPIGSPLKEPIGIYTGNKIRPNPDPPKSATFGFLALYGTWEALDGCKILPRGVGTIRRPGKHHSGRSDFQVFLGKYPPVHKARTWSGCRRHLCWRLAVVQTSP